MTLRDPKTVTERAREDEFHPQAASVMQTEHEYKLTVPPRQVEALWQALTRGFKEDGTPDPDCLPAFLEAGLSLRQSTVAYVDYYYDTPDLTLLKQGCGLRHRVRLGEDAAEVIQLKTEDETGPAAQKGRQRIEQSFSVWRACYGQDVALLEHRLLHEHRESFKKALSALGVPVERLQKTLALHQYRRRLHLDSAGQPLLLVTLDKVESRFGRETFVHDELEIELAAGLSPEESTRAQALAERVLANVRQRFPELHVDQTAKYRKAFDYFDQRLLCFSVALRHQAPVGAMAGSALVLIGVGALVVFCLSRLRRR